MQVNKLQQFISIIRQSRFQKKETWIDMFVRWVKTVGIACRLFYTKGLWDWNVPALTYSSVMAFVPLMAMLFAVAKGFGYSSFMVGWVNESFQSQPQVADAIIKFVENYLTNTKDNYIIGVGIVMMLFTLLPLIGKVEESFNMIWRVEKREWLAMLRDYIIVLIFFTFLVLLSSGLNVFAVAIASKLESVAYLDMVVDIWMRILPIVPMSIFFVFVYSFIPNTFVKWKCTLVPAIFAGVCMSLLQYYYLYAQIWLSSYNFIYGSFAALPLFLLWLMASWTICLGGAALCYVNQNIHHFDNGINENTCLTLSVQRNVCALLLHHICKEFKDDKEPLSAVDLSNKTQVPQYVVNCMLEKLVAAGLIVEIASNKLGPKEELSKYHPHGRVANITYGKMLAKLDALGDELLLVEKDKDEKAKLETIINYQEEHIKACENIILSDI